MRILRHPLSGIKLFELDETEGERQVKVKVKEYEEEKRGEGAEDPPLVIPHPLQFELQPRTALSQVIVDRP